MLGVDTENRVHVELEEFVGQEKSGTAQGRGWELPWRSAGRWGRVLDVSRKLHL